jgi:hypothetical protein
MDISILGLKMNVEILILIGVVYLILVGHTFCGCCHFGLMEGLDTMDKNAVSVPAPAGNMVAAKPKEGSTKPNGKAGKEGFVGANTNYGQSSPYDLNSQQTINTASWSNPDLTVVPGKPLSQGVKDFLAREPQPVPLPEGEMLLFANTPFKPECCPNTYSNSSGCACMTAPMYNYLIERGGNNVPYSQY